MKTAFYHLKNTARIQNDFAEQLVGISSPLFGSDLVVSCYLQLTPFLVSLPSRPPCSPASESCSAQQLSAVDQLGSATLSLGLPAWLGPGSYPIPFALSSEITVNLLSVSVSVPEPGFTSLSP